MLTIRLFRVGKNNQPFFKIVITDKRKSSTAGRFVEEVGCFNPLKKEKILKQERIKYWLSVGAKPSPTIFNLLVSEKIIEGKKIDVHKKKKIKKGAAETVKTEVPKGEAPAPAETPSAPEPPKPAPEPPKEEEPKPEAPKEEKPVEEKPLKEDKSSFRPSPSKEGSGKEEKQAEPLTQE